jgi:hypothetical protein
MMMMMIVIGCVGHIQRSYYVYTLSGVLMVEIVCEHACSLPLGLLKEKGGGVMRLYPRQGWRISKHDHLTVCVYRRPTDDCHSDSIQVDKVTQRVMKTSADQEHMLSWRRNGRAKCTWMDGRWACLNRAMQPPAKHVIQTAYLLSATLVRHVQD